MESKLITAGLVEIVRQNGHILNHGSLHQVFHFYTENAALPDFEKDLRAMMPEYGRSEYLMCVNQMGKPVELAIEVLDQFREMSLQDPAFGKWFQEAELTVGKTLLPARWLCHLAGIRHRAVQLFIDDPYREGYTLVQVRSAEKAEAPGCFDIPVAGHIDGLADGEETLFKEMKEELELDPQDIKDLIFITGYDTNDDGSQPGFQSTEYRLVWRCRLKKSAWAKIVPGINEVAGIAAVSKGELSRMVRQFPERFASGIKASLPLYLNQFG